MKRLLNCLLVISFVVSMIVTGCAAPTVPPETTEATQLLPAKPEWQQKWEGLLSAAQKEGKLTIYSTMAPELSRAFYDKFGERYGIKIEFVIGRGAEVAERLIRERSAGIYQADILMPGATTALTSLKPAGILGNIGELLVLPEVLDGPYYI